MSRQSDTFTIGIELDGAEVRRLARLVSAAETHGFSFASFDDSASAPANGDARVDSILRAAFVSPTTSSIGLVPVSDVIYGEPFHLATQLASLDHASRGRAGFIVRAELDDDAAAAVAWKTADANEIADEAADVVAVSRQLWDSWSDDAVIRDRPTGRYIDRDRVHYPRFEGRRFSITGPSIISRPPQGQLVVFAPGSLTLAADIDADVVLVDGASEAELVRSAASARGRGAARVFAEIEVALDAAGEPARARVERLDAVRPWASASRLRYVGDSDGLTELLTRLAADLDGVRLHVASLDTDLDEIGYRVLPALRQGGVHTPPVVGNTLRDIIGLARPANRFEEAS